MNLKEEILKIRFIGDGISPKRIKVSHLGAVLSYYEKALRSLIDLDGNPPEDDKKYYLTLTDITSESAGYGISAYSPKSNFNSALLTFDKVINGKATNRINNTSFENINRIAGWQRSHKCDAEIYYGDQKITTVSKNLKLSEQINLLREYTTIYGTIIDVGKLDPRIEIKLLDGSSLFFGVNKDRAVELGSYLYRKIGLVGIAKINPETFKIIDFELKDFVVLKDSSYKEKFEFLRNAIGDVWDEIDDPLEYLKSDD